MGFLFVAQASPALEILLLSAHGAHLKELIRHVDYTILIEPELLLVS